MKKIYDTVFDEYLGLDLKGNYQVRLGPKIYLVKASTNYTPDLDKVFFGGRSERAFDWHSVLVKETPNSEPRTITDDELSKYWFKPSIKKIVNYQRAIKRRNATQSPRYSANQRIAYNNAKYN